MLLAAAAILFGFVILIWRADLFAAGAASSAKNRGMSPVSIGLTTIKGFNHFNVLALKAIPGIVPSQIAHPAESFRDYLTDRLVTLFLAIAIFVRRARSKSAQGHLYLGRILGTLLVSSYALYYYLPDAAL